MTDQTLDDKLDDVRHVTMDLMGAVDDPRFADGCRPEITLWAEAGDADDNPPTAHVVLMIGPLWGLSIRHVDATVVMERPKLGPHKAAIRAALAAALAIGEAAVNVKATTGEGMAFVGRGEGGAALAVATVAETG